MELGATGQVVAENIKTTRQQLNLTFAELSRRLTAIGQPIPELGLRRIEKSERKVDVDELLALSSVFRCTPLYLITPEATSSKEVARVTGFEDLTIGKVVGLFMYGFYDLQSGERIRYKHDRDFYKAWDKSVDELPPKLTKAIKKMYESLKDMPGIEEYGER